MGAQTIRVRVFVAVSSPQSRLPRQPSRRPPRRSRRRPASLSRIHIGNFGRINDNYFRGAQPSGTDYRDLAAIGREDRHRPAGGRSRRAKRVP